MTGIASNEAYIVFDDRDIAPWVVVRTEKHIAVSVVYLSYAALRIGDHSVTGTIVGLEGDGAGTNGLVVAHGLDGDGVCGGVPNLYIVNKPVVDVARV